MQFRTTRYEWDAVGSSFFLIFAEMDVLIVHTGAGNQSIVNRQHHKRVIRKALLRGTDLRTASSVLERSPWTNTGRGASLNIDGEVRCDACFIHSNHHQATAMGALYNVVHLTPISRCLDVHSSLARRYHPTDNRLGLSRPLLVDDHSDVDPLLVTPRCRHIYDRFRHQIPRQTLEGVTDTIGVTHITTSGTLVAASSGGNFFKLRGRIGCAAVLGSAIAHRISGGYSLTCMCSGNGEDIMAMQLARAIVGGLSHELARPHDVDMPQTMQTVIQAESSAIVATATDTSGAPMVYVGTVCAAHHLESDRVIVAYCHTTESFFFGFRGTQGEPEVVLSTQPTAGRYCRGQFRTQ